MTENMIMFNSVIHRHLNQTITFEIWSLTWVSQMMNSSEKVKWVQRAIDLYGFWTLGNAKAGAIMTRLARCIETDGDCVGYPKINALIVLGFKRQRSRCDTSVEHPILEDRLGTSTASER
jgi:hypothetical protein